MPYTRKQHKCYVERTAGCTCYIAPSATCNLCHYFKEFIYSVFYVFFTEIIIIAIRTISILLEIYNGYYWGFIAIKMAR